MESKSIKGTTGLFNLGNTCFMSCVLQLLHGIPEISEYIITDQYLIDIGPSKDSKDSKEFREKSLTKEFAKLLKALSNLNGRIVPKSFYEALITSNDMFEGFGQHDAQELLAYILDILDSSLQYNVDIECNGIAQNNLDKLVLESANHWKQGFKNKFSIIKMLFHGQTYTTIKPINKIDDREILSEKFEEYNMLILPIKGSTIYKTLEHFFEPEKISNYFDEKTGESIDVMRHTKLMIVPKILILVIKRYASSKKITTPISFPIDEPLDFSSFCEGYDKYECDMNLISICCHMGGLTGGHYFTITKHHSKNIWLKCDDDKISEINIMENRLEIARAAYMLVYRASTS